ncbi:DegT/DnrJ/EryC1/StrS family aminotransferase [Schinkia azotoformans]|uniref:DegT/DnrJ/EryC1/StrS aminotransferase n=1 Tax=Schinkia azotoformans LMG 9581 TaxID=1131731 RepID=K6BV35_SCHAZ|nr:DegT/DnrJ/EryC1/StrS family aminotransferase [Schinkia azotoformans]EKN62790.1 DegT/DnrJ/EryC1/StrS aminotransferase [Schinkia azotoformans LMG 9581]MEC1639165.1 DegT/DnrJ/EryC1/StrS family aminotransferase [Schinkia azotoformans]MEC1945753.1 DegT/DnrJ/EryC1/StrS family aminotransferase [Schinkia azotoformans]
MENFKEPIMVTKSFLPPLNEYMKELERIWDNSWLTNNGEIHNEFEKNLVQYLGVPYASLFVNGHLALETAIKSQHLTGQVITTPFTFTSTTHAIVNCGLEPIFCDIEPSTYNIDAQKIEDLITEKTTAIVPVHVFGNPCDVFEIEKIAKRHNLKVIYDAAHAFGVEINGVGIGNYGDISMFSMHATKVFHSIEGGVLTYSDNHHKSFIDLYKNFGISGPEDIELIGINAKMNEFQAAMGLVNIRYVENEIAKRRELVGVYRYLLKDIKGITVLEDMVGIKHNYAYFPILVDEESFGMNRNELHETLKEYNIFTRKYFYPLITNMECYSSYKTRYNLPVAERIANSVLTLPIYSRLSVDDIEKICSAIKKIHQNLN